MNPPTRKKGSAGMLIYHHAGGGAIGLYAAVLENAEGVLNECYGELLAERSFIEDMIARKFKRNWKTGPDRPRMFDVYTALLRWKDAQLWFTEEGHGAVSMKQVFDIAAIDPEVKRKQLASRLELPWSPFELMEALAFYYVRIRNQINAHKGV